MKQVYLAQLDRFGYTLTAVGRSKEEARTAITDEYMKAYVQCNDCEPDKEELEVASDEICVSALVFGQVEWM